MESSNPENQWYWSKKDSDEQNGPVGREQLEKLAEEGTLGSEDLVWREGFDDWKEAGSVEEIEELFASPPPLPDDSSDRKDEEPPTLPQSGPEGDGKATESEAISCVHDYDEDNVCQKCGWSKTELKKIDESTSEDTEKSEVLEKFEVEWGGWVFTSDSTLTLRRDEISLIDIADEEVALSYERVEVKEIDERKIVLEAPIGFDKDVDSDTNYTLKFNKNEDSQKAAKIIKDLKGKEVGVGDQLSEEASDDREKVTVTEESKIDTSKNKKASADQKVVGSDGRYWYSKKRWLIPFFFFLVPIILWNGYRKYFSRGDKKEWFDVTSILFLQLVWFLPVGWYGVRSSKSLTKKAYFFYILMSPLFLFSSVTVFTYGYSTPKIAEVLTKDKQTMKKEISEANNLEEAIEASKRYATGLRMLGKNDEKFVQISDSLNNEKAKKLLDESESTPDTEYDRKIELVESAKEYLSNVDGDKYISAKDLNARIENIREEKNTITCNDLSGTYEGTFEQSNRLTDDAKWVISSSCRVEIYKVKNSDGEYYFEEEDYIVNIKQENIDESADAELELESGMDPSIRYPGPEIDYISMLGNSRYEYHLSRKSEDGS